MTNFSFVENDVFAELYGIALVNVLLLKKLYGPATIGTNILDKFSKTMEGERVCVAGAVVPIIGITGEYYTVTIRSKLSPPTVANTKKTSTGWVFKATAGASILCGLGYLAKWNPKDIHHRQIAIPPGWYAVDFGVGFVDDDPNHWGIDFIFTARPEKPEFTADMQSAFHLHLEDESI